MASRAYRVFNERFFQGPVETGASSTYQHIRIIEELCSLYWFTETFFQQYWAGQQY